MANYERYDVIRISSESLLFEFESIGPKGTIKKIVELQPTADRNVYNLAFGNLMDNGRMDDLTANDNKDRNKILATVGFIIESFTMLWPEIFIFFAGSTPARTRLYRIAISLNYQELSKTFLIWGLLEAGMLELFNPQSPYTGFLIRRK